MDCQTCAAINGHAFGAGFFIALACDWRLMRTERGFLCFPEAALGMRLSKGFAELAKAKLTSRALREAMLSARRYSSHDALVAGMIDRECVASELADTAQELATSVLPTTLRLARFDGTALRAMKTELYTEAFRALTEPGSFAAEPQSRL